SLLDAPREREPPEPPYHPHRLTHDLPRHLALALGPVHKDDGNLDDAEPLLPHAKAHLDLERVAVRAHRAQIDCLENGPAKALEPARGIFERKASYGSGVEVREVAQDEAVHGPI